MIERRHLLSMAAALPAAAAFPKMAKAAFIDRSAIPMKPSGPVEVLYKTPTPKPNGMDVTPEGMWIIDQSPGNMCTLFNPANGQKIRDFSAEGVLSASGICVEGDVAWIGSTYNRLIVSVNSRTGKLIQKYSTPGAGQIYKTRVDQAGRRSPLPQAAPPPPPAPVDPNAPRATGGRQGAGKLTADTMEGPAGTGAHCILTKGNLLWVTVPPARMTYVIDKESWIVQEMFPTVGDRPHDMSWSSPAKTHIWASDSNLDAFFLHDAMTGRVTQGIQLPNTAPIIHGAKLYNGYMYCCDDTGWLFRFRMPA